MRAFEAAANAPWAIQEEVLRTILEVASLPKSERSMDRVEAVAAKLGRPLNNTQTTTVRDGVAVIPVIGPVFRYANLFTEVSGATSTQVLSTDFRAAIDDPNVKGILLEIDSPGGEAHGIQEVAQMIHDARKTKPVVAYVSGNGASAAYWLASAASEVVLSPTSAVGSIGVVSAYRDTSEQDAREGVKTIEFVSTQSPNKRPDFATDAGRAQVQQMIDAMAEVFVGDVARNRGKGKRSILNDFGGGGMLVGQAAVDAGMADRLGSFEQTLAAVAAMNGNPRKRKPSDGNQAADETTRPGAAAAGGDDDMDAQANLAAAQLEVATLTAKVATLGSELLAEQARAVDADKRAAEAQALAAVGKDALKDLKAEYLGNRVKLNLQGAEGEEIAALLEERGNYARLKQLRDDSRAQVFQAIPAGTRADVSGATSEPQSDAPELNATELSIVTQQAQRSGKPLAECKKTFLAAKAARESRGLLHK